MSLQTITDKSLKARYRRQRRNIAERIRRGEPYPVVAVCVWELLDVRQELMRRGLLEGSYKGGNGACRS